MTHGTDTQRQSDKDWLLHELEITAERAAERGMPPEEFIAAVDVYSHYFKKRLEEEYEDDATGADPG